MLIGKGFLTHSAALLVLSMMGSAQGANVDKLFWSDSGTNQIWTSNTDGSDASVILQLAAGAEPRGIALDGVAGHIYWAENGTNRIRRANLDGTNIVNLVSANLGFPADIELDLAAGKMYWADRDLDWIRRANLDGTGVQTVVNLPATGNNGAPYFLELDPAAGHLYWSDFDSGVIHRANLADGTGITNIVTGQDRVRDIVVDSQAGLIYFSDRDTRLIRSATTSGGSITTLHGPTGLVLPHGLDLNPNDGMLYWADSDGRIIFRGAADGSIEKEAIFSDSLNNPWDIQVLPAPIPEPGMVGMMGLLTGLAFISGKRRSSRAV